MIRRRPTFARETIVRLRYPTVRDHGKDVADTSATPDELEIKRCWLEPIESAEDHDGKLAVLTGYKVDAPANVDVLPEDHVRYRGDEWEVDGDPLAVPSPSGAMDSTLIHLRRWKA